MYLMLFVIFQGAIEYVKLISSSEGYIDQCPHANIGMDF